MPAIISLIRKLRPLLSNWESRDVREAERTAVTSRRKNIASLGDLQRQRRQGQRGAV
ncbi:hypothetical protein E2C01_098438 [Portunus trituberculatus]|uniref:Uncharacterized protein n=1 Tax=Portunus trituberculatus TaxID=210409 RepID=A0A5B7K300_PORTR|nr:hypothetical protein [Portunus trituberculatus]